MAESFNEDDDLARLKQWWKENGLALVLGAGVGLAAILGWQWWQAHVEATAMEASALYDDFRSNLSKGDAGDETQALAEQLRSDFSGTPYATQAALSLARYYVEREEYKPAIEQLKWVVSYTDQEAMRHIARVRQARLLWAQDKSEQALELLNQDHPAAFTPLYAELKGDISAEAGELEAAREAYRNALQEMPVDSDKLALQRKLQDVGGTVETVVEPASNPGSNGETS